MRDYRLVIAFVEMVATTPPDSFVARVHSLGLLLQTTKPAKWKANLY